MQEGERRSGNGGEELSNQSSCDRRREQPSLVCRGQQQSISVVRASDQELAYDYYTTLANIWDDPNQGEKSINKVSKE